LRPQALLRPARGLAWFLGSCPVRPPARVAASGGSLFPSWPESRQSWAAGPVGIAMGQAVVCAAAAAGGCQRYGQSGLACGAWSDAAPMRVGFVVGGRWVCEREPSQSVVAGRQALLVLCCYGPRSALLQWRGPAR